MKTVLVAFMILLLTGCVTDGDTPPGVDVKQAARINMQLGVDYMRKGQMQLALAKLERAVDQDPELAQARNSLAFCYAKLGEPDKAEQQYRKALVLDPENGNVRNNFGVFLCGQDKASEARRLFMEAARNPNYTTPEAAWTNAGVCALSQKDRETAASDFREALKINPLFGDALSQMANISYQRKDYLRARAFTQRFLAVSQPTPEALWVGLMAERKLGDLNAAHQYERRLKLEFPDSDQAITLKTYKK
jgi:type IV pilus assembly protein PilF